MTALQLTDFEIAVLIGVGLAIVLLLVLIARRNLPAPAPAVPTTSTANPADLAAMEGRIKAVETRLTEVDHNLAQVRTMLNALPTKDSVYAIGTQVTELKGDLKLNNAQTAATAATVERIMNWLMDDAKAKATGK